MSGRLKSGFRSHSHGRLERWAEGLPSAHCSIHTYLLPASSPSSPSPPAAAAASGSTAEEAVASTDVDAAGAAAGASPVGAGTSSSPAPPLTAPTSEVNWFVRPENMLAPAVSLKDWWCVLTRKTCARSTLSRLSCSRGSHGFPLLSRSWLSNFYYTGQRQIECPVMGFPFFQCFVRTTEVSLSTLGVM